MVFKYASAILKTFATGTAIVVTGIVSSLVPAFGFTPNLKFGLGTVLVVGSIFVYGYGGQKKKTAAKADRALQPSSGYDRVERAVEMK